VMFKVALRLAALLGVKVTEKLQLVPELSCEVQVLVWEKSCRLARPR
jgi:hypothetical protein